MSLGFRNPYLSYSPSFRIRQWDEVDSLMDAMMRQAVGMPGLYNYGFTRSGDLLNWRSEFDTTDSLLNSMTTLNPLIEDFLRGPAELNRLDIFGPGSEFDRIRNAALRGGGDVKYFEHDTESGFVGKNIKDTEQTITCDPFLTVKDWSAARPLMQEFVNEASNDKGCNYFAWNRSDNTLNWKAKFKDGDALVNHLKKVRPLMDNLIKGPAVLERLEIHGPQDQTMKLKDKEDVTKNLPIQIFEEHGMTQEAIEGEKGSSGQQQGQQSQRLEADKSGGVETRTRSRDKSQEQQKSAETRSHKSEDVSSRS